MKYKFIRLRTSARCVAWCTVAASILMLSAEVLMASSVTPMSNTDDRVAIIRNTLPTEAQPISVPLVDIPQPPIITEPQQSLLSFVRPAVEDELEEPEEELVVSSVQGPLEEDWSAAAFRMPTPAEQAAAEENVRKLADDAAEKQTALQYGSFMEPWRDVDPMQVMEFDFNNADLQALLEYMQNMFHVMFILDDMIKPPAKDAKVVVGTKLTFKTYDPLSPENAWNLFLTFLDIAGATLQPGPAKGVYRVVSTDPNAPQGYAKGPLPTFIGTDPDILPTSDMRIRYLYFVKNTSVDIIKNIVDSMKSASAPALIPIPELRALLITDKAYNIRMMLEVVQSLDGITMPETLAVVRLKHADAAKIEELYKILAQEDKNQSLAARLAGGRRAEGLSYFTPGTRVIAERRTNTLILLGTREAVSKLETFILQELDVEVDTPFTPIHVVPVKYVQAEALAAILQDALKFRTDTDAAKFGGIRDGDKYFSDVTITAEKTSNSVLIVSNYEDYLYLLEKIKEIDVEQPQVALKVLILAVGFNDTRNLGAQIRSKEGGALPSNITFQTSGLGGVGPIQTNDTPGTTGAYRLLANLAQLATNATIGQAGTTLISLGSDAFGLWGLVRWLQTYAKADILQKPFIVTTNNYTAQISIGEKRVVPTSVTQGSGGPIQQFGEVDAELKIKVTPRISLEGFVTLDIYIENTDFTQASSDSPSAANRTERKISTSVIMADNEVLALGGLIRHTFSEDVSNVPLLNRIPILGSLFASNKNTVEERTSILILINPIIINPADVDKADTFTNQRIKDIEPGLDYQNDITRKDPIQRWFFKTNENNQRCVVDDFMNKRYRYLDPSQKAMIEEDIGGSIQTYFVEAPRERIDVPVDIQRGS